MKLFDKNPRVLKTNLKEKLSQVKNGLHDIAKNVKNTPKTSSDSLSLDNPLDILKKATDLLEKEANNFAEEIASIPERLEKEAQELGEDDFVKIKDDLLNLSSKLKEKAMEAIKKTGDIDLTDPKSLTKALDVVAEQITNIAENVAHEIEEFHPDTITDAVKKTADKTESFVNRATGKEKPNKQSLKDVLLSFLAIFKEQVKQILESIEEVKGSLAHHSSPKP
jgi:predicted Zn-dependent protease with MMP-like domain